MIKAHVWRYLGLKTKQIKTKQNKQTKQKQKT